MKHTQWRDDFTRVVKGRATAYRYSPAGFRQDMPFTNVYGNGGLLTTVADLILWWDALYRDRLGAGFLNALTTPGMLNSKHTIAYALGVSNGTYRGAKQITHGGATAGYRAYLAAFPETRTTIAVLCNNATSNAAAHAHAVADVVLANELKAVPPRSEIKAAADIDVNRFAGMYRDANTDETYRFEVRDGRLRAGGLELVAVSSSMLRDSRLGADVEVRTDEGVTKLRIQPDDAPATELVRVEPIDPPEPALRAYAGTYTSPELGITYRIVVGDGRLVVKRHLQGDLTLAPTYRDAFSNFGSWVFTRDGAGAVNGFLYTQGRVRRVRFVKSD
jgi:hypothetical protein